MTLPKLLRMIESRHTVLRQVACPEKVPSGALRGRLAHPNSPLFSSTLEYTVCTVVSCGSHTADLRDPRPAAHLCMTQHSRPFAPFRDGMRVRGGTAHLPATLIVENRIASAWERVQ
jgi:hypothetical protein